MAANAKKQQRVAETCTAPGCENLRRYRPRTRDYARTCSPECAQVARNVRTGGISVDASDIKVRLRAKWQQACLAAVASGKPVPDRMEYMDEAAKKSGVFRKWERAKEEAAAQQAREVATELDGVKDWKKALKRRRDKRKAERRRLEIAAALAPPNRPKEV